MSLTLNDGADSGRQFAATMMPGIEHDFTVGV